MAGPQLGCHPGMRCDSVPEVDSEVTGVVQPQHLCGYGGARPGGAEMLQRVITLLGCSSLLRSELVGEWQENLAEYAQSSKICLSPSSFPVPQVSMDLPRFKQEHKDGAVSGPGQDAGSRMVPAEPAASQDKAECGWAQAGPGGHPA